MDRASTSIATRRHIDRGWLGDASAAYNPSPPMKEMSMTVLPDLLPSPRVVAAQRLGALGTAEA